MIKLFNVSKYYDGSVPALLTTTIHIEKGEFVFVTGPSGAGKSTLLKLIYGTELPTDGQMIVNGRNFQKVPRREVPYLRRRTGFVFQDFMLLRDKNVFDNVALALKIRGLPKDEIKERVTKMLAYLKIQHRANFNPLSLSGGEQQRVAIARALIKEPILLLADEPTGNLDPDLAFKTMELFREANNQGTTVIVATHDRSLMERYHKRVITLDHGRVLKR